MAYVKPQYAGEIDQVSWFKSQEIEPTATPHHAFFIFIKDRGYDPGNTNTGAIPSGGYKYNTNQLLQGDGGVFYEMTLLDNSQFGGLLPTAGYSLTITNTNSVTSPIQFTLQFMLGSAFDWVADAVPSTVQVTIQQGTTKASFVASVSFDPTTLVVAIQFSGSITSRPSKITWTSPFNMIFGEDTTISFLTGTITGMVAAVGAGSQLAVYTGTVLSFLGGAPSSGTSGIPGLHFIKKVTASEASIYTQDDHMPTNSITTDTSITISNDSGIGADDGVNAWASDNGFTWIPLKYQIMNNIVRDGKQNIYFPLTITGAFYCEPLGWMVYDTRGSIYSYGTPNSTWQGRFPSIPYSPDHAYVPEFVKIIGTTCLIVVPGRPRQMIETPKNAPDYTAFKGSNQVANFTIYCTDSSRSSFDPDTWVPCNISFTRPGLLRMVDPYQFPANVAYDPNSYGTDSFFVCNGVVYIVAYSCIDYTWKLLVSQLYVGVQSQLTFEVSNLELDGSPLRLQKFACIRIIGVEDSENGPALMILMKPVAPTTSILLNLFKPVVPGEKALQQITTYIKYIAFSSSGADSHVNMSAPANILTSTSQLIAYDNLVDTPLGPNQTISNLEATYADPTTSLLNDNQYANSNYYISLEGSQWERCSTIDSILTNQYTKIHQENANNTVYSMISYNYNYEYQESDLASGRDELMINRCPKERFVLLIAGLDDSEKDSEATGRYYQSDIFSETGAIRIASGAHKIYTYVSSIYPGSRNVPRDTSKKAASTVGYTDVTDFVDSMRGVIKTNLVGFATILSRSQTYFPSNKDTVSGISIQYPVVANGDHYVPSDEQSKVVLLDDPEDKDYYVPVPVPIPGQNSSVTHKQSDVSETGDLTDFLKKNALWIVLAILCLVGSIVIMSSSGSSTRGKDTHEQQDTKRLRSSNTNNNSSSRNITSGVRKNNAS